MSLSKRLLVIFYTTMLLVGMAGIAAIYLIGSPLVRQMEEDEVRHRVDRVEAALMHQLTQLHMRAQDWAARPEISEMLTLERPTRERVSPLDDFQLAALGLGMLVIVEPDGDAQWSGEPSQQDDAALAQLMETFHERFCYPLWGVIKLADDFYLFAIAQAADCGAILMAQRFDNAFIEDLKGVTGLAVHFVPDNTALGRDHNVKRLSDYSVVGEFSVRDYLGQPVMRGTVDSGRSAYQQGLRALTWVAVSLLGIAALGAATLYLYVQRTIFSRLQRLRQTVRSIARGGNLMQRVSAEGHDELAQLAHDFNTMVDVIGDSQQAMARAKWEADAANRAKSLFLANISHEIRTPMSAILGYAELLENGALSAEERQQYISIIQQNGDNLLALINGVLDLSRIEAGEIAVSSAVTQIGLLMKEVVLSHRLQAQEKNLELRLEYLTPLPQALLLDAHRLRQILTNLLGNALKFTRCGQVVLEVRWDDVQSILVCTVSDTGIGMDAAQVSKVFQPFYQADDSNTRRYGGAGLGLSIAVQLTELMGGQLTAEATPGQGSRFTLQLPAELVPGTRYIQPEDAQAATLVSQQLPVISLQGRVLVADDNQVNRLLLRRILMRANLDVEEVDDGQALLERLALDEAFDLVILDMQMPRLDGYAAARQLRASGFTRPILALTASALQGERQRCLDAGCSEFLAKPVRAEKLLSVCRELMQAGRRAAVTKLGDQ